MTAVWLGTVAQDLRYALRGLRKTPALTAVAVLTLALGIGANTAIFNVVDAALLRPLPFPDPDRLLRVWSTRNGASIGGPSRLDMRDLAGAAHSFDGLIVYDRWRKNVSGVAGSAEAEEMVVGLVPGEYFQLLGVRPILGRVFTPEENTYGKHHVAIVSAGFWRARFREDSRVIGRTLRINAELYSIVGVVPDAIPSWMDQANAPVAVWTPFASVNGYAEAARGDRGNLSLGRLKPGVPIEQARSELAAIADRLGREHPADRGVGALVESLADTRAGPIRPILLMLSGAVGLVLLIACANLAGLLLARNSARYREFALRAALGAGRPRLVRQLLLETILLTFAGAVAGLGVAAAAGFALVRMSAMGNTPYTTKSNALAQFWTAAPDLRILLFTFGVAVITAMLFGIAPALAGSRVSLADALREGGRSASTGAARQQFRRALVTAEVALSLVLVFGAALLVETMIRLERRNPGFPADHLLLAHVYIPPQRYPDAPAILRFCDAFGERVRALPGVVDASVVTGYPPSITWNQFFTIDDAAPARIEDVPVTRFAGTDARFLKTLGIALVRGRDFMDSDTPGKQPVAIVNEEFARRYFSGRDPIGRQIRPGMPPGIPAVPLEDFGASTQPITIVGMVRDFMNDGPALPPQPQLFALFGQLPGLNYGFKDIAVRTATDPESLARAIARELHALDPDIPLGEVRSMETHLGQQTADTRFTTMLLGLFAALGIVLAIIGAYGVVAYLVSQRTQEIGVRIALGATTVDILWLVSRYGLSMGAAGVALGLAGSLVARRFFEQILYGVSPGDPLTLAGAAVSLLVVIGLASAIPARRAMRIDPVEALRGE
jgi:putative ABC transport system permease protein